MKKTFIIYILSAFVGTVLFSSCIDDDMNIDPNKPSSVTTPSLIITAEKMLVDNLRGNVSLRGSMLFSQYFSQISYTSQSRYDIPFSYSDSYWQGLYLSLNNLDEVIKLNENPATKVVATANGAGRNATQIAIVRILKSYAFYALTDVFGNIPYQSYGNKDPDFEALHQSPENIIPRYASQEKIYADLLSELKAAADTLLIYQNESTFGQSDIIYKGNNHKWALFANSLRLRFATRLKEKNTELYNTHFADALDKGVFTSNEDNAVFKYSNTSPNEAPLYQATVTANRKDFAVSKVLVDLLIINIDPRLSAYALPNEQGEFVGLPYGLTEAQSSTFTAQDVSLPSATINAADYSEVLMEYSEVAFLISEYNSWSETDYKAGVKASLEKWRVESVDVQTYLDSLPAATKESVLTQKYIALYGQGLEAWSEYRRTGYPDFLIQKGDEIYKSTIAGQEITYTFDPLFGDGGIPARLYYPVKEQSVNQINYREALQTQGDDRIETKLWIFK